MNKKNTERFRINEQIQSANVRIVGDNVTQDVYDIKKALQMANDMGLDLVEIGKNNIPICKLVDYQKFLYDRKKRKSENDKKNFQPKIKELRFSPVIGDHDYDFKMKQGVDFLKEKHRVQITITFHGRMITHIDKGYELVQRLATDLQEYGRLENKPKLEGKRMLIIFNPK